MTILVGVHYNGVPIIGRSTLILVNFSWGNWVMIESQDLFFFPSNFLNRYIISYLYLKSHLIFRFIIISTLMNTSTGVVTYPFNKRQIWGFCHEDRKICNIPKPVSNGPIK